MYSHKLAEIRFRVITVNFSLMIILIPQESVPKDMQYLFALDLFYWFVELFSLVCSIKPSERWK